MHTLRKRMAALAAVIGTAVTVSLAPAAPAAAEVFRNQGEVCGGRTAPRCAWMNIDSTNNRVRGYGSIFDNTSSRVYVQLRVRVEDRHPDRAGWRTWYMTSWEGAWESLQLATGTAPCDNNRIYRVTVEWDWNGTTESFTSKEVKPNVC